MKPEGFTRGLGTPSSIIAAPFSITQRLLLSCLAVLFAGGCSLLKHKPQENTPITAEVQATLRKRWVDKRVAVHAAASTAADAPREQAEKEFAATYDSSQPKPERAARRSSRRKSARPTAS